jgi:glycosyltransferase involved in cell wall biosynthesis
VGTTCCGSAASCRRRRRTWRSRRPRRPAGTCTWSGRRDAGDFAAQIAPHLGRGATWHGHLGGRPLVEAVGRAAAVLVTPEWDEPFGLVAAEAAMCGTPVVAFDRGGISEVLRPHVGQQIGIVVPEGDVAGMAAAIGTATAMDRAAVRAAALSHLSAQTMVGRYEAVLRAAAAGGPVTDQVRVAAS